MFFVVSVLQPCVHIKDSEGVSVSTQSQFSAIYFCFKMSDTRKKILIVDDSSLITERLVELLNKETSVASIAVAKNYDDALQLLTEKKTDIVFLDIHLPGKNGIELLKFIIPTYPEIKVVMLSNESNEYYKKLCLTNGALYFIDKSNEFELISGTIALLNNN